MKVSLNKGALRSHGYDSNNSIQKRRAALKKAIATYGGTSVGRKLNYVATINKNKNPSLSRKFKADANWVNKTYTSGGRKTSTRKGTPKRSTKRRTRKRSTKRRTSQCKSRECRRRKSRAYRSKMKSKRVTKYKGSRNTSKGRKRKSSLIGRKKIMFDF